ncbi:AAA family ATPase [Nostoc sp. FACHB-152]|uniref:AAA family ATPase n=1 Tax=unclassified Nostoc TaxID=2593658 RepID=UPI001689D1C5|nr:MULTISPECIES: AAA family ATPase [unclassified Nostoc]MBD2447391.1 AAA family ATPase [Nostoc sp. FACHB-152]MBD2468201.1 AAA family ATPase [Nostoc sp. FACHB-145]
MSTNRDFPPELLNQSKDKRLDYYSNECFMLHPYLNDAFNRLKRHIEFCGDSRIVLITGPTGVGKTTLLELTKDWVKQMSLPTLEADKGCIPVADVEASLEKSGLFNPKAYLKRCLYALSEPENLIEHKINYGVRGIYRNDKGEIVVESKILETELGWALEQALKQRHPYIFLIDEAHHMLSVASGRKLTDVPEAIKSLANRTKILHGLFGTYQLLALQDIGDQLSRRSVYIHIPRYNAEFIEDIEMWQSVVWSFQQNIPTDEDTDFTSHWEYLYERSLGCVGILKNWTSLALKDALNENAKAVTLKHLERRALSVGQCQNILKTIKQGEARYAEIEGNVDGLRQALSLKSKPKSRASSKSDTPHQEQPEKQQGTTQSNKGRKGVGQRNPQRDEVGMTKNAT